MATINKICIDPGHGGEDRVNRGHNGYIEADGVLDISLKLRDELKRCGFEVLLTRETDKTVSLADRASIANDWGADLVISEHTNAAGSETARGIEVIHSIYGGKGKEFADIVYAEMIKLFSGRRVYSRKGTNGDYYAVIRNTKAPCVIIESGFHTNPEEEKLLLDPNFRTQIAVVQAKAICTFFEVKYIEAGGKDKEEKLISILGKPVATREQARIWLQNKASDWVQMADLYYSLAAKYGIRADIALCQACKETGFFRFGGIVRPEQNNFCGLSATGQADDGYTSLRGADSSKVWFEKGVHGAIFADWVTGVEAHLQHLYAYATEKPLPDEVGLLDPRFVLVRRGTAPYVQYLGAGENPAGIGWAYPGKDYGHSIIYDYLVNLLAVLVSDDVHNDNEVHNEIKQFQEQINQVKSELQEKDKIINDLILKLDKIREVLG